MTLPRSPWWALAFVLVGCARTHVSGKPIHQFPSQAELGQIAARAASSPATLDPGMASIDVWQIETDATDGARPVDEAGDTPWDGLLRESASQAGATPSHAMRCLARELSRVHLLNGQPPDLGLHRFLAGRCGALVSLAQTVVWKPSVPDGMDAQTLFDQWAPKLREELTHHLAGDHLQVGLGLSRAEGKVVLVLATATPAVDMQTFGQVVDAQSQLLLQGRLRQPSTALMAYINDGAYGVRPCEVDPAFALPEFRIRCVLAAADDHAWIQVSALPPGRVLSSSVLEVLALRSPEAAHTYTRRALGEARPVKDDREFRSAVVELVNTVRARAKLPPIKAADQQSQAVSSLVTPFFDAFLNSGEDSDRLVNRITLGLMAGWAIQQGLIRDATFVAGVDIATPDAARWLCDALDHPSGRLVLLDAEAETLALGARVQQSPGVLAAIAVSYRFFSKETAKGARAGEVIERLARVRKARALGETVEVKDINGMTDALASIEQGEATPSEAMQEVMNRVAFVTGRSVRGLVWETNDLDAIEFPNELLVHYGQLMLGAGVTFYKAPGAAWGQYTVIFVVVDAPSGGEV